MTADLNDCIEAQRLHDEIYAKDACGCCWHIVLDEGNIDDDDIEFCIKYANATEVRNFGGGFIKRECDTRSECQSIGAILLKMSYMQRNKLINGGYRKFLENQ